MAISFDQLRQQTAHRRAGAVATDSSTDPPAPAGPAAEEAPAPAGRDAFCDYWKARFAEWQQQPPSGLVLDAVLRAAPESLRPSEDEARLFVLAGSRELPYRAVADWLTVRAAAGGEIDPAAARHWLRRLEPFPERADDPHWPARCRQVAADSARAGCALSPEVVAALVGHPQAARGYFQCAARRPGLKSAPPGEPARRGDPGSEPSTVKETAAEETAARSFDQSGPAAVEGSASTPGEPDPTKLTGAGGLPGRGVGPVGVVSEGGIGMALGGLIGNALAGARHGFARAMATALPPPGTPRRFSSEWFQKQVVSAQDRGRQHQVNRAAAAAGQAVDELAAAGQRLEQHPRLVVFWREVDREANLRFNGQRTAVLREISAQPRHPLRQLFERQRAADPDVALWHARAHAAFERVRTTWAAAVATPASAPGTGWSPTPEQQERLRAACRCVPPAEDRPALVEHVEHLLRELSKIVRQAFARPRTPTAGAAP